MGVRLTKRLWPASSYTRTVISLKNVSRRCPSLS
jgi:hypothetical protein